MEQESNTEDTRLTSGDVFRVFASTLGVGILTAGALLLLFAVLLGQALGGLVVSLMGRSAAVMSDGMLLVFVVLIFAGQLVLSRLLASRITPSPRRRSARKLALALSLVLCCLPVLGFVVMSRAQQTRHQDLAQKLEQKLAEERKRRRAEEEARIAEMNEKLEYEKKRLEEEAALVAQQKKLIEEAKRKVETARPRKKK